MNDEVVFWIDDGLHVVDTRCSEENGGQVGVDVVGWNDDVEVIFVSVGTVYVGVWDL